MMSPQQQQQQQVDMAGVRFESAIEKKQRQRREQLEQQQQLEQQRQQQILEQQKQQQQQQREEEEKARLASFYAGQEHGKEVSSMAASAPLHDTTQENKDPFANLTGLANNHAGASASGKSEPIHSLQSQPKKSTTGSTLSQPPPLPSKQQQQQSLAGAATYDINAHDKVYIQALEAAEYAEEVLKEQLRLKKEKEQKRQELPLVKAMQKFQATVEPWQLKAKAISESTRSTLESTRSMTLGGLGAKSPPPQQQVPSTRAPAAAAVPTGPQFSGQDLSMAFEGRPAPVAPAPTGLVGAAPPPPYPQRQQQPGAFHNSRGEEEAPEWLRQKAYPPPPPQPYARGPTTVDYGLGPPSYTNNNNHNSGSNSNNKTAGNIMGASALGGVAGLLLAGPVVGLIGAAGIAYGAATGDGFVAKTLRTVGGGVAAASSAVQKAKQNHANHPQTQNQQYPQQHQQPMAATAESWDF